MEKQVILLLILYSFPSWAESISRQDREGGSVRFDEKTTIKKEDYLIGCGQACALEASTELVSALGFYFQNFKQSSQEVSRKSHQKKVIKCIKDPNNCSKKDKKATLNASLHYNFGKWMRNSILHTTTHRQELRSLPGEEGSKEKYLRNERETYEKLYEQEGLRELAGHFHRRSNNNQKEETTNLHKPMGKIDFRKRDNFKFDLNKVREAHAKLAVIDPKFVHAYRAFINRYTEEGGPALRNFALAKELPPQQGGSSVTAKVYDLDTDGQPKIDQNLAATVRGDHDKLKQIIKEEALGQIKAIENKQNTKPVEIQNILPSFYSKNEQFLINRLRSLKIIADPSKNQEIIAGLNNADPKERRVALLQLGFSDEDIEIGEKKSGYLAKRAGELYNKLKQDKIQGKTSAPEEAALLVNKLIDRTIASQKKSQGENKVTYHLNIKEFDTFLDQIWPTDKQ